MATIQNLLEVKDLTKTFPAKEGFGTFKQRVYALNGVSFVMKEGETLGLVGESGSGKSTVGRLILRLLEPDSGQIQFAGKNLLQVPPNEMRSLRKSMQIIFQDPFASLNPKKTIEQILEEPFIIHKIGDKKERKERVATLLQKVGLRQEHRTQYPHEFSGGQRQRIGIARAIALNPKFIIADEPVSALDVSVRAQILNLLQDLQNDLGISFLFISHDMSVVSHFCDRVAVLYLGKIIEMGNRQAIFERPAHPYTEALLSAVPQMYGETKKRRILIKGDISNLREAPGTCVFKNRCPIKEPVCDQEMPELKEITPGHFVACHLRS